ncbi:hypothetical protein L1049_016868 [Liquidambar formosana]|uniref:SMP domain-containing protein n=1 Tax=Liquidambar formosana TaxID=63359 RepID=A0AAP0X3R4_LIQFO
MATFFPVSGDLASKPVAPQDAAMMQTAETIVWGQTQKGGPAAAMQSAATLNERAGLVDHRDLTGITGDQGVTVAETNIPGSRIVTESIAGQVVGQYVEPTPMVQTTPGQVLLQSAITIGEALEATARTVGDKPVDQSDAAAIQAAEVRATGSTVINPGGLAASAQSAASFNAAVDQDEDRIKLKDILTVIPSSIYMFAPRMRRGSCPADKAATREDAEGVMSAEMRHNPNLATHPGGVAASVAAAARLNEQLDI